METNDDATVSKLSAVDLGYYKDDFLHVFVKSRQRRPPLINRGYFARVAALRKLSHGFFSASPCAKQVVCLGAGFDTSFFQLRSTQVFGDEVNYFEVDFPEVVANKMRLILTHKALYSLVVGEGREVKAEGQAGEEGEKETKKMIVDQDNAQLNGRNYHLLGADLREVDSLDRLLQAAGLDKAKPTLFISECVLIYLQPEESAAVIRWAGSFAAGVFLTYEMIRPDDPFGRMMLKNLETRGVLLHGIRARPDLAEQKESYLSLGWERADALDMNDVYNHFIDKDVRDKAARLEIFDEMEEWNLIQGHYCIVCAVKEGQDSAHLFQALRLTK